MFISVQKKEIEKEENNFYFRASNCVALVTGLTFLRCCLNTFRRVT